MRAALCLALGLSLCGCYYLELSRGQLSIINDQRTLRDARREEGDPERRKLLSRVPDVISFARTVLQLRPGRSYAGYYESDPKGLTYVLVGSEKTALEAYTWWFPIAGEVPYKSYFDRASAVDAEQALVAEGYDTFVGRTTAYSTLGILRDPVTTVMLERGVIGCVEVLIHELVHARLYVAGETDFNEQLASFAAREGTRQYFRSRSRSDPVVMRAVAEHFARKRAREDAMVSAVSSLERLYARGLPRREVLRRRERVFRRLQARLAALYPDADSEDLVVNNARLLQFARYSGSTEYLQRIWQDSNRNWVRFWPAVERYVVTELDRE